jgi:hypothetical protein
MMSTRWTLDLVEGTPNILASPALFALTVTGTIQAQALTLDGAMGAVNAILSGYVQAVTARFPGL